MSAKNPLIIIKAAIFSARTRAYHVKKIEDMDETVNYVADDISSLLSPELFRECLKSWIRDLLTNKFSQSGDEQLDLWKGDYFYPIKRGKKTVEIALHDLVLDDIAQIEARKENNISAAIKERDRFLRHSEVIKPLLVSNPDWKWGDAVMWLESNGGLPDLN